MENVVKFDMCSNEKVRQEIVNHPNYKVRWMAGFAWKGAGSRELKREGERKIYCLEVGLLELSKMN